MLLTQKTFPCKKCGASQVFYTKGGILRCEYCKSETKITPPNKKIVEHPFKNITSNVASLPKNKLKCPSCSASFDLDPFKKSSKCPFCKTPIISNLDLFMPIAVESILPFKISKQQSEKIFKKWIKSLWLAPTKFKTKQNNSFKLVGVYIPYWTFDSFATATYRGLRGKIYHQNINTQVVENGKLVNKRVTLTKTKWTPVSGEVKRAFDDVLIGATKSISRRLTDSLAPWDLQNLLPYDDRYLSGFESEVYQVDLQDSFKFAKDVIRYLITQDIRVQIGGDKQKITYLNVTHSNVTYKHILLPIWHGEFLHDNKKYNFTINARTGKIKGNRPYSKTKIFMIVFVVLVLIILITLGSNGKF